MKYNYRIFTPFKYLNFKQFLNLAEHPQLFYAVKIYNRKSYSQISTSCTWVSQCTVTCSLIRSCVLNNDYLIRRSWGTSIFKEYYFSCENTLLTYLTSNCGGRSFSFCPKQQVTLLFQRASQLTGPTGHESSHMKIPPRTFWELNQICHPFSTHKSFFWMKKFICNNKTRKIINLLVLVDQKKRHLEKFLQVKLSHNTGN